MTDLTKHATKDDLRIALRAMARHELEHADTWTRKVQQIGDTVRREIKRRMRIGADGNPSTEHAA